MAKENTGKEPYFGFNISKPDGTIVQVVDLDCNKANQNNLESIVKSDTKLNDAIAFYFISGKHFIKDKTGAYLFEGERIFNFMAMVDHVKSFKIKPN